MPPKRKVNQKTETNKKIKLKTETDKETTNHKIFCGKKKKKKNELNFFQRILY